MTTSGPSPVETFIDKHGAAALSVVTSKKVAAVRLWRYRHRIPRSVWPDLMVGLGVTLETLRLMEEQSRPFADQRRSAA